MVARAILPQVSVHLIRNSIKYVPSKDFKAFTQALKKGYSAPSLKACQVPLNLSNNNGRHIQELLTYGAGIFTTSNSSLTMAAPVVKSCISLTPWKAFIQVLGK
ncbi:hypothetical protein J6TS1_40850 [Siminovitchia terrae]|uniref:Uncharacterized protein n=1 Tax=Siminovitchia terrae TaxID=1914933 RepID=A0ABQ4L1R2_SIMTE|nr:hypothetical protein J6TS1_40850 [Siminovitchia terrae]